MLRKILGVFKKVLKGEKGYTLIEVAAVVAITATLSAVVVPIAVDKIGEGKISAALGEVNTIASSINALFADTGEWPVNSTSTQDQYHLLYSGTTRPSSSTIFSGSVDDVVEANASELSDHLVTNGASDSVTSDDLYDASEWRGKYMAEDRLDPWGNPYVVYVEYLHKDSEKGDTASDVTNSGTTGDVFRSAWVLSAGPDEVIATGVNDDTVQDDDIGIALK